MDPNQYVDVFIDESAEHLDTLYQQLVKLEEQPDDDSVIEEIFRAAHTIKGMSATMGYDDLADLTHHLENVFDSIREGNISVTANLVDVLYVAVDELNEMVQDIASEGTGAKDVQQLVSQLDQIAKGEAPKDGEDSSSLQEEKPGKATTQFHKIDEFERTVLKESSLKGYQNYEITIHLTEDCLLKAARAFMVFEVLDGLGEVIKSQPTVNELEEENFEDSFSVLLVSKHDQKDVKESILKVSEIEHVDIRNFQEPTDEQSLEQQKNSEEIKDTSKERPKQTSMAPTRKTIRVNIDRLDVLMNLFEELVIDRGRLEQISLDLNHHELQETVERMSRVSNDLQNIILNMRMVPIEHVFNRFPSMVRQLGRELNKKVTLEIKGAETELDRTVIDEIGDPLVHLIRNAIDHGIEAPVERRDKGKPEQGMIQLHAYHSGNYVFIEITDDGAGINQDKILNKAIENQLITKDEATQLSDEQIYELMLESGFSTTESVSDISGRGVGLDVVKNTIESLGGSITIQSKREVGSTFSIQLPLTLSIISALLIQLENEKYAIPLSSVIETAVIKREEIFSAHHKAVIDFRGKVVPLVDLRELFDLEVKDEALQPVVIVKRGEKMAGLLVDSFIGQQEVVLKSLGSYLTNVFAISGATILGDGEVALIIDTNALVK